MSTISFENDQVIETINKALSSLEEKDTLIVFLYKNKKPTVLYAGEEHIISIETGERIYSILLNISNNFNPNNGTVSENFFEFNNQCFRSACHDIAFETNFNGEKAGMNYGECIKIQKIPNVNVAEKNDILKQIRQKEQELRELAAKLSYYRESK